MKIEEEEQKKIEQRRRAKNETALGRYKQPLLWRWCMHHFRISASSSLCFLLRALLTNHHIERQANQYFEVNVCWLIMFVDFKKNEDGDEGRMKAYIGGYLVYWVFD
jgi:hypothetical protein